ncbi:MAG TPA: hypothetical protein VFY81_06940 [Gammaproteobacteria bacterium]|nr:hypothetical protein [Gammaproteobacteria bacterium]
MNCLPLRLFGCLLVFTLAGCVPPSGWPPFRTGESIFGSAPDRDLTELLTYYQELGGKSATALEQERKFYQAALIKDRCTTARMRLALVLLRTTELGARVEGGEQVVSPCLLEQELGRNVHLLAYLVHKQLVAYNGGLTQRQEALQALEVLKKENQELRRQVDGLKAIERSLQDRRRHE